MNPLGKQRDKKNHCVFFHNPTLQRNSLIKIFHSPMKTPTIMMLLAILARFSFCTEIGLPHVASARKRSQLNDENPLLDDSKTPAPSPVLSLHKQQTSLQSAFRAALEDECLKTPESKRIRVAPSAPKKRAQRVVLPVSLIELEMIQENYALKIWQQANHQLQEDAMAAAFPKTITPSTSPRPNQ